MGQSLNKLGIKHDYFFSETEIVKKKLVNKSIEYLKKNNFVEEGFLEPPKGDEKKNWIKVTKNVRSSRLGL